MSFPASARIDEDWLDRKKTDQTSEWELVSTDIANHNFINFFVGNGYVGQSVPPEGEGSWNIPDLQSYPGARAAGGCQIHGFSDRTSLLDVPRWSGLRFYDGQNVYSRFSGMHAGYTQTLNMRHGTITTDLDWFSGEKADRSHQKTHITITLWLSRTHRNLGVIRFTITPDYDGTVWFEDTLDGTMATGQSRDWRTETIGEDTIALSARMGSFDRRIHEGERKIRKQKKARGY